VTEQVGHPVPVVLVHSPLLGPSTWRWVAEQLGARGHHVAVPDLRAAASAGDPQALVAAAAATAPEEPALLVGHSGAGWLLPSISGAMPVRPRRLVFADAGIPPCAGTTTVSVDFLPQLRRLAHHGVLPRWSKWWGRDALAELLPDPARRRTILDELPQVPLAFFETPIALPRPLVRTAVHLRAAQRQLPPRGPASQKPRLASYRAHRQPPRHRQRSRLADRPAPPGVGTRAPFLAHASATGGAIGGMRVRVSVQASPRDRASWLGLARDVEAAGFHALYAADHPGSTASPFVALAAAAAVTERIQLGTCVVNAGVWEPLALASEAATLDVVSGGRAVLGVGAGHTPREWTATGRRFPTAPPERPAHWGQAPGPCACSGR